MNFKNAGVAIALITSWMLMVSNLSAQSNGGFESGLTNWTADPPSEVAIRTTSIQNFPSEGSSYAEIQSEGSGPGTPGYGPHTAGVGAGNVTILSREFNRPSGSRCDVQIDWNFFLSEELGSAFNDFLSIDVIDVTTNALVRNVVYIDGGGLAGIVPYTGVPGSDLLFSGGSLSYVSSTGGYAGQTPAPSGLKRAFASLQGVPDGALLRLDVTVGNGGDSFVSSTAVVDNFRVVQGGINSTQASLRVLASASPEGFDSASDSGADFRTTGPIDFGVQPGQRLAIRTQGLQPGLGFVLLTGTVANDGSDFGYGDFNLRVSDPISVLVDGINPPTVVDAILGTTTSTASYIEGAIPVDNPDAEVGIVAVMEDPTSAPLFLRTTATTRLQIQSEINIPRGDNVIINGSGDSLGANDFGIVNLTGLNGGLGFTFYGTTYTQCFVSSNGYITFGTGDTENTPTARDMFQEGPRIAVMWSDFDASATTGVEVEAAIVTDGPITISWIDLAEANAGQPVNRFSVQLFPNGTIVKHYGCLTLDSGLVGITAGDGVASLLAASTAQFSLISTPSAVTGSWVAGPPIFEIFGDDEGFVSGVGSDAPNDIMTLGVNGPSRISYIPSSIGYRVITGVR